MDIPIDIERVMPKFILRDHNGYAIAKAIEKCLQIVAKAAQDGIDIILDPDKMPEWRLDEMAGELNCLYDYNADVEKKRYWIKNANYLYSVYGTPQAIYNFLEGYFQTVAVEEFWEYGGDPFHFRVVVSNPTYDAEKIAWAQKAIEEVKNVRSVLDNVTIDTTTDIVVSADTDFFYVQNEYPGDDTYTGANDIADWETPIDPALTDVDMTDEGVTG